MQNNISKLSTYRNEKHERQERPERQERQVKNDNTTVETLQLLHANTKIYKTNSTAVEYKYICIKKDLFDVNMIKLKYDNIKKCNHIDIIYKSPTLILDGLFFKTPPISSNDIILFHKDNQFNNIITIKLSLNIHQYNQFIQMLISIDEYISSYINKISTDINLVLNDNSLSTVNTHANTHANTYDNFNISMYRYDQIIKFNSYRSNIDKLDIYQVHLKSYLDKNMIYELEKKLPNKQYILTFNISNIYIGNNTLNPIIKCNKCDIVE
jgi:hypothetical protein